MGRGDADDAVPEAQHADLGGRLRVSLEEQARQPVPERDGEGRLPFPAGPAFLDLGHGPRQILQMLAGLLAARGAGARAQRLRAARDMSDVDGRPGLIRPLRDETDAGTMEFQMRELRHVSPEEEYLTPAERIERRILAEGEGGARGSAAAPATLPRLEQRKAGRRRPPSSPARYDVCQRTTRGPLGAVSCARKASAQAGASDKNRTRIRTRTEFLPCRGPFSASSPTLSSAATAAPNGQLRAPEAR